jgi:HlyD family secretion protein
MDRILAGRCPTTTINPDETSKERRLAFPMSAVHRVARVAVLVTALVGAVACGSTSTLETQAPAGTTVAAAAASDSIRLSGTVEAVRSRAVIVPRLQGPLVPLLIIDLVPAGTRVEPGDLLVEFDPQQQEREAFDRRAEVVNLDGEIAKKRAEQAALEAKDRTELTAAEHDVERARLDVRKNDLVPRIDAEKNTLALTQAIARFDQLKLTFDLKRKAAAAEIRILEIRRDRAERALRYAEGNAKLMQVQAPFGGLVVVKRMYRNGNFVEIAEGDEVRPGTPVVDIVDTSDMRVSAKLNQADARFVRPGQVAKVGLDGFPDLLFEGRIESITPLATASQLTNTVRSFTAIVSIKGSHPQLLPDLTAWVDLVPDRAADAEMTRRNP